MLVGLHAVLLEHVGRRCDVVAANFEDARQFGAGGLAGGLRISNSEPGGLEDVS